MVTTLLQKAINAAQDGKLIIYPTDTQYALGCTLTHPQTIQHLFNLKKRPNTLALPIAVATIKDISTIATITPLQKQVAHTFLPGPLTMVLPKKPIVPSEVTASGNTLAIRIPNHPITLQLLHKTGPLIITSANIHGQKPYEDIHDIQNQFGEEIAVYLPGGILNQPPSTIIDFTHTPPQLLRSGPISLPEIINVMTK
jgi:L-threonylcarbamoyladenylate synthase